MTDTTANPLKKLEFEVHSLKIAFSALDEELGKLRRRLSELEKLLVSLQVQVEDLRHSFELELEAAKAYADVVSRVESRIALLCHER